MLYPFKIKLYTLLNHYQSWTQDRQTGGWVDGWMDRLKQMDGRTDGYFPQLSNTGKVKHFNKNDKI